MRLRRELREAATDHIEALGRFYSVQVRWRSNVVYGLAVPEERYVVVVPIETALDYMTALHEIGHVIAPRAWRRSSHTGKLVIPDSWDEINVEGAAWAWAARKADPEIVSIMSCKEWAELGRRFATYVHHWATKE